MGGFKAKKIVCAITEEIKAPPNKIFPLLCPVEESKWINNWECEMVHSDSGLNEKGCIFIEQMSGPVLFGSSVKIKWLTTRYEPHNRIQFVLMAEEMSLIIFDIEIVEQITELSLIHFQFTYIPFKKDAIDKAIEEKLMFILTSLLSWLKYYCETGEMLK